MTRQDTANPSRCAVCGSAFHCAMAAGDTTAPCWCFALPHLMAVPSPRDTSAALAPRPAAGDNRTSPPDAALCLCAECLKRQLALRGGTEHPT